MKKFSPIILVLLTLIITSCSSDAITDDEKKPIPIKIKAVYAYSNFELEVLDLINLHRNSLNLAPLKKSDELSFLCLKHDDYMIKKGVLSHDNSKERIDYVINNLKGNYYGENVAQGQTTAQQVVQAWINSPGHRANLEKSVNTHFGLAVKEDVNGVKYYCNIFATL